MKDKHGELARIGLPGLLHQIYLRRDESAVLDVIKEPVRKRFFFRHGVPVAASSNILNEVLGRLLMQEGIITQQQYETSLETVLKEKKRHGEVLIGMGLLTPQLLDDFLSLQLKRRLFKLFEWEEGSYRYIKTALPTNIHSKPFHPASLILEGISLGFYPVAKLKAGLEAWLPKNASLSLEGNAYRLDDFHLNLQEKRFVESLDGTKTLAEALSSSDLLLHRAESIAMSLVMTELLEDEQGDHLAPDFFLEEAEDTHAPEVPVDSKLNAELLFMRARTAISRGEYSEAIPVLRDITNINPAEGEYWAWLGWAIYNQDPSKIKEAESIIKDSIDLNNDLDSAWFFLGMINLASGNIAWAQRSLEAAIQKNPWNTEALSELKRLELRLVYRDAPKEVLEAFGFSEDPFSPVPRKVSLSEVQSATLETLARAVRKRTGPVLLEGKGGTGKTTLVLELLRKLSSDKVLSSVVLKPASREMELIKDINRGLGCPASALTVKDELLSLGMRVSQNRIQGGSTLIVIDEAHRLTNGCLKLVQYLSRLKAVQILLSCDPSFSERLKSPDFQELDGKVSARITLTDFTKEETTALLDSMLLEAKRSSEPGKGSFSIGIDEAEEIFENTNGNLGAIRREAASLLQKAFDDLESMAIDVPGSPAGAEKSDISSDMPAFEVPPEPQKEERAEDFTFEVVETEARSPAEESSPSGDAARDFTFEVIEAEANPQEQAPAPSSQEMVEEAAAEETPAMPAPQPHPAMAQEPQRPQAHEPLSASHIKEERPKRSVLRLVIWVVLMIAAGLIAGSLIGTYWFGQQKAPEEAIAPPPPRSAPPLTEEADKAGPLDSSLDMAPSDGSI